MALKIAGRRLVDGVLVRELLQPLGALHVERCYEFVVARPQSRLDEHRPHQKVVLGVLGCGNLHVVAEQRQELHFQLVNPLQRELDSFGRNLAV